MRILVVIISRALGRMLGQFTSIFAFAAFLAASGAIFAYNLLSSEGSTVSAPSVWALSVMPVMPALVSLLSMRLWEDDAFSGRGELDLVVPVPEREFALGRFLAALAAVVFALVCSLAVPLFITPCFSPVLAPRLTIVRFLPAFSALAIFAVPLAALGSLAAAAFRRPISAAVASIAVTSAVPWAVYRSLLKWSGAARMKFAEFPVAAQIADAADGFFSTGAALAALAFSAFAVYAASKAFALRRFVGSGFVRMRISSFVAVVSALLASLLLSVLAMRLDFTLEWPGASRTAAFSARTRGILAETSKPVVVTVYMSRDAAGFLPAARLLRALAAESRASGGAEVSLRFVDPRWDPNASVRIARAGVPENTLVFSSGRRRVTVPVKDADESVCASAVQRLSMPDRSETVFFVSGHGEPSIGDYSPGGFSEAARSLRQEGYRVSSLFLPTAAVPENCSVLVCAGSRMPFSAGEIRALERFLAAGGRLLVAHSGDLSKGSGPLLESRGVKLGGISPAAVVSEFGDHPVSRSLDGAAVTFAPGSVQFTIPADSGVHKNGYEFSALCSRGDGVLAFAAEMGVGLKHDLAIRPARVVAIGDVSFFRNGAFMSRANANRDFFLNSVAWLAGLDVSGHSGASGDILSARMDRSGWIGLAAGAAVVYPALMLMAGMLISRRKRRMA